MSNNISLPHGIEIVLKDGGGTISSNLADDIDNKYCVNTLESLILSHACMGVDVESEAYVQGLENTIEVLMNCYN